MRKFAVIAFIFTLSLVAGIALTWWYGLIPALLTLSSDETQPALPPSAAIPQEQSMPTSSPASTDPYVNLVESAITQSDTLSYNGYEVIRLSKRVRLPMSRSLTEVSYAVLRRNGRVLATFDGVYSGWGNATDFGLFPLLGGETPQLFISQTVPRGGRHWIISLEPTFRVLYDSGDYGVGRDSFWITDLDDDGKYELSRVVTAFYGFENLASSETPLPEIIFKYDEQTRRYLPANTTFQSHLLSGVEERIIRLNESDGYTYLSQRLDIVLDYIYAGQEQAGWEFFDREYRRPDREEMKAKIKAVLRAEPAYRFIYGRGAT